MRFRHFVGVPRHSQMRLGLKEEQNDTSFIRDKCCNLTLCLRLMEPHCFWRRLAAGRGLVSLVSLSIRNNFSRLSF